MLRMTGCSCSLSGCVEAPGTTEISPARQYRGATVLQIHHPERPEDLRSLRARVALEIFIQKKDEDVNTSLCRISQMSVNINSSLPVMIPSSFHQKRRNGPPHTLLSLQAPGELKSHRSALFCSLSPRWMQKQYSPQTLQPHTTLFYISARLMPGDKHPATEINASLRESEEKRGRKEVRRCLAEG